MIRRILLISFLLGAVAGVGLWLLDQPYNGFRKEAFVEIPPGTTTRSMARLLARSGVVASEWHFLAVRALRPSATLQAGEYNWTNPASAREVFDKIARGDIFYYEVTVPEGSNIFDIAAIVDALGTIKSADFLNAAKDPSTIRDLAPGAPSLEGYLFPSTYRVTRHTSARQLCREMTSAFRKAWHQIATADTDVNRITTLASLVEKETAVPQERPTVASVYANRLQIGMKLDCDPTTIYAALLQGRYRGTIYRSDLDSSHPYNTYHHAGLPPGPIANPGLASLKAAAAPAVSRYLYFVAKPGGGGSHLFSETLQQHNVAVAQYRSGSRKP